MSFRQARRCQLLRVLQLETNRLNSFTLTRPFLKPLTTPVKPRCVDDFFETALLPRGSLRYKFLPVEASQRQLMLQPVFRAFADSGQMRRLKVSALAQALANLGLPGNLVQCALESLVGNRFLKKTKVKQVFSADPDCILQTDPPRCSPRELVLLLEGLWVELPNHSVAAASEKLVELGLTKEHYLAAKIVHRAARQPPDLSFAEFQRIFLPILVKTCLVWAQQVDGPGKIL